jgi:glutathionylspermidine synthase
LGLDQDGYFVDHVNDRIPVFWKMYDWSDLQNDMANDGDITALASRLETGEVKILEPLWKQVLSNKGAMAMMWEQFQSADAAKYLLATYLDTDNSYESTQLLLGMHVRKPLLGLEGVAISIETGFGAVEQKDSFGYGAEGFIIQEYIELPAAFGYYYTIGSWVIDGEAAGIIIRGDTSKITGRHCLIIPHIVSDNGLYIAD